MQKGEGTDNEDEKRSALQEFKAFIKFLTSMYGILTDAFVLFPYSNVFIKIVPLGSVASKYGGPGNGPTNFTPEQIGLITTLVIAFLVLWAFGNRFEFITEGGKRGRRALINHSWIYFIFGIAMLISYIFIYWNMHSSRYLDFVLLFLYIGSFCLIDYAFMRLAMIEYFGIGISPMSFQSSKDKTGIF